MKDKKEQKNKQEEKNKVKQPIDWKKTCMQLLEHVQNIFYDLQDICSELKFRHKKAVKKRQRLKKKLSPEAYKAYRKKELTRQGIVIGAIIAAILLLILLISGIANLIRFGSSPKTVPETETETISETETEIIYPEKTITVGSTGSMLLHSPFIDSYPDEEGEYDFSSIYTYITSYYSEPDFMTCEFEGALGGADLGYSGYPSFKAPDVIIENLRDAGIDLQMLANNHIYDGWSGAFQRTMDVYDEKNIAYTGIRQNRNDKQYYIANINGVEVGFINYTYETTTQTEELGYGSGKSINGLVLETEDGERLNSFDYEKLTEFYAELENNIYRMKQDGARFIIAQMHWGTEYQLEESDLQREIAQTMCDMGVDALIGGHPHCEQPIDVFSTADGTHDMFCIFSEGNALSNQRAYLMTEDLPGGYTEDGVMITLTLHQSASGEVNITDVDLLPTWVYRFENNGSKYYILPLDDVDNLEQNTGISGIYEEAKGSYDRTMEILGEGWQKAKTFFKTGV